MSAAGAQLAVQLTLRVNHRMFQLLPREGKNDLDENGNPTPYSVHTSTCQQLVTGSGFSAKNGLQTQGGTLHMTSPRDGVAGQSAVWHLKSICQMTPDCTLLTDPQVSTGHLHDHTSTSTQTHAREHTHEHTRPLHTDTQTCPHASPSTPLHA